MTEDNGFWMSIMFMSCLFTGISAYFMSITGGIIFGYLCAYATFKQWKVMKGLT